MNHIPTILFVILSFNTLWPNTPGDSTATAQDSLIYSSKPKIYHEPKTKLNYNKYSLIECVVDAQDDNIISVKIFIKSSSDKSFSEFPMKYQDGKYIFLLIPEMTQCDNLYYFIIAELENSAAIAYPSTSPEKNPVELNFILIQK